MHSIERSSLQWNERYAQLQTSNRLQRIWSSTGMPRIDDSSITTVGFLYPTRESAERNERLGGTGFIIGKPVVFKSGQTSQIFYVPYMVSNRHVAYEGYPYIRINRKDSKPYIIEKECHDWVPHPSGDDLCATCIFDHLSPIEHDITFIRTTEFITPEKIKDWDVGLGDEIFMVGRFINHQGREKISPAVRQGNISMMLEPIWRDKRKFDQESFAVEMRSRTGFSGSPVFVYRTLSTNIARTKTDVNEFHALLGVNYGYIKDEDGENTWLNGVIPAWKILELLEEPVLKQEYINAADKMENAFASGVRHG